MTILCLLLTVVTIAMVAFIVTVLVSTVVLAIRIAPIMIKVIFY